MERRVDDWVYIVCLLSTANISLLNFTKRTPAGVLLSYQWGHYISVMLTLVILQGSDKQQSMQIQGFVANVVGCEYINYLNINYLN